MIENILLLHSKQCYRNIKDLGPIRAIILFGLLVFVVLALYNKTASLQGALLGASFYLLLILTVHIKRSDIFFLKCNVQNYQLLFFIEYLLFSIPLLICLFIHQKIFVSAGFLLLICPITLFDFKFRNLLINSKLQLLIPETNFEWKAGFRKTFFIFVPLWVFGLLTPFTFWTIPVALFILGILSIGFVENSEPLQMMLAFEMNAQKFLYHKIKLQILIFSFVAFPLMAEYLLFNFNYWYIPLLEYIIFISIYTYLIFVKYAYYAPNKNSLGVQLYGSIGALSAIIPFFLPITWVLIIYFYNKSKQNLTIYLNDYN